MCELSQYMCELSQNMCELSKYFFFWSDGTFSENTFTKKQGKIKIKFLFTSDALEWRTNNMTSPHS